MTASNERCIRGQYFDDYCKSETYNGVDEDKEDVSGQNPAGEIVD